MSSINGFPDIVTDWRSLLHAFEQHAELLGEATEDRDLLQRLLQIAEKLKTTQLRLQAERQVTTQQLNAALAQGKDAAIRIRSMARGKLGPKNLRLLHFRVAPIRPRRHRLPDVEIPLPAAE
jgi:hypothetical protein